MRSRRPAKRDVRFRVRVVPRGSSEVVGAVAEGVLRVRVAAPPVDDAANRALARLVAIELDIAPSAVRVVAGRTGRLKTIALQGVDPAVIRTRWPGLALL